MRAAPAMLLLVVACNPSPPAGSPCGPNGECPSELECAAVTNTCEKPGTVTPGTDADVDSPGNEPDASPMLCAGTFQMFCVDEPTDTKVFSGTTTIDTDTSPECATSSPNGYCVIAASIIQVQGGATLTATGSKPLVLLADTISIDGLVDVGSTAAQTGAGANSSDCIAGEVAGADDGGCGGSFGGLGGAGSVSQTLAGATQVPTAVRGGCTGGDGAAATGTTGRGSAGGGAVAVLATGVVSISSNGIVRAGGAGGRAGSDAAAGGGGGSGGMIVIEAQTISNMGAILANGGGGGGSGTGSTAGADGTTQTAAAGGMGTASTPGNGGVGSSGNTLTGGNGTNALGPDGAGGGGAGVTKLIAPQLVAGTVSPPPT